MQKKSKGGEDEHLPHFFAPQMLRELKMSMFKERPVRDPDSHRKSGQAWREEAAPCCLITPGKDYGKLVMAAGDHLRCPNCHKILTIDRLGGHLCTCLPPLLANTAKTVKPERGLRRKFINGR